MKCKCGKEIVLDERRIAEVIAKAREDTPWEIENKGYKEMYRFIAKAICRVYSEGKLFGGE